jgi:RNA-directed DNA polymerase
LEITLPSLELSRIDADIITLFKQLQTRSDIANILEITEQQLKQHLYITRSQLRYKYFVIKKRSGGKRVIMAPITPLKIIQRKLNYILQLIYKTKPSVHGFTKERSIVTNASIHVGCRLILNLDLKDFFPSINFGRVRGMFLGKPYFLNKEVATCLAQIVCHENQLPQGAPTSPVVSNMICAQMDAQLQKLARKYGCLYTRYADDITLSTYESRFPRQIVTFTDDSQEVKLSSELTNVITNNGFIINEDKVRLQAPHRRQEVTGLVINNVVNVDRKYIRQLRAMLYALKKHGLDAAEKEHYQNYRHKEPSPHKKPPSFERILFGKLQFLAMVRGRDNEMFIKFWNQFAAIATTINIQPIILQSRVNVTRKVKIHTEGKTDWMHLKAAFIKLKLIGKFKQLEVEFDEYDDSRKMGDEALKTFCKNTALSRNLLPTVFVFDCDKQDIVNEMSENGTFKNWGNNTYSLVLPIPIHRKLSPDLCIEMYYTDDEIKTLDSNGRRLFLSNEFHPVSGKHLTMPDLNSLEMNKIKNANKITILDNSVYNLSHVNVALTKNKFAQYILMGEGDFANFDPTPFEDFFAALEKIANLTQ